MCNRLLLVALCLVCVSCGRSPDAASKDADKALLARVNLPTEDLDKVVCVVCPKDEAEVLVATELTLPGISNTLRRLIPVKRTFACDIWGVRHLEDDSPEAAQYV
ncbi:MAG: hypothetical protein AMK75_05615, partial [Planctomycetes bacterium SM23_65]